MQSFVYTIKDEIGIHARPAGMLAKEAKKFSSKIEVEKDGKSADVRRMMGLMGLGVKCGEAITVKAEGEDEAQAIEAMKTFFAEHL
ncbi:HPr family phosphocarrier protein [Butyricicoccus sp.]|uniref:HPr family phosphocarrier protein n=1 Tax=Butyricicoccus sp. TaxID=2049021 RepID=UPI003736DA4E